VYDVKCSQIEHVDILQDDPLVVVIRLGSGAGVIRSKLATVERAREFAQYISESCSCCCCCCCCCCCSPFTPAAAHPPLFSFVFFRSKVAEEEKLTVFFFFFFFVLLQRLRNLLKHEWVSGGFQGGFMFQGFRGHIVGDDL